MDAVVLATSIGLVITKLVDMLRNLIDPDDTKPKAWWNISSAVLGVGVCVIWRIDVITGVLGESRLGEWPALILSGLVVGAVGSGWHEGLDWLSSAGKARKRAK